MDSAKNIYMHLIGFKNPGGSEESSERRLLRYCSEVLGGVERLHIDFKQKRDSRHSQISDDDKKNLAKAVSGFANSSGGVLVWGIEDRNMSPKPIEGIEEFIQSLLELAPLLTDPIVQGIDGDCIMAGDRGGFGVVFIPESFLPPHRVILNHRKVKNHYYIRSGGSFVVATHTQLEDMFGRRPKSNLSLSTRILLHYRQSSECMIKVLVGIENKGRGTAKSPFLAIKVHPPYEVSRWGIDGNGRFGLEKMASATDLREQKYGASASSVIHPGIVHDVALIKVPVKVNERQNTKELVVDYRIAAEGIQPIEGREIIQSSELWAVIE